MRLTDRPIDGAEFSELMARFAPFEGRPTLAVATSGGGDSSALALLAHDWAEARGGRAIALVVDHGLREGSTAEAEAVASRLERAGIAAAILTWTGPKPTTAIQASARETRYRLLLDWCRANRILHLLLAHQSDDQAETVLMRQRHGSGSLGLAGMSAIVEHGATRILRPLLPVGAARARATLRARGWAWIEDPSNVDRRFERVRAREALAGKRGGETDSARGHGAARERLDRAVAIVLAARARFHPAGFVRLETGGWRDEDGAARRGALRRVLLAVGATEASPRPSALEALDAGLDGARGEATLAGCLVLRRAQRIIVCREPARVMGPLPLAEGQVYWDHRFLVAAERGDGFTVRALGTEGWRAVRHRAGVVAVPEAALLAFPSLWNLEGPVAVPHLKVTMGEAPSAGGITVRFERPRALFRPFASAETAPSALAGGTGRAKMSATGGP